MRYGIWRVWATGALFVGLLASAATLTSLTGCKKGTPQTPGGPSAPPAEVRLGYFANVTHAQAVLGVSSGDFEKAVGPSKFTTKVFNAGPELIEALNGGNIDIGYIGPGPAITAFTKGQGKTIRVIAGSAGNGVVIVAAPDSGITKLEDLKGRRVATPQLANTQDIAAKNYLKSVLNQSDVANVSPTKNAEVATRMLGKQIDAAWVPEPWGAFLEAKAGAKVIASENEVKALWPEGNFATTCVITTPKFLEAHPDVIEKVLGVHVAWTDRMKNEPDKWQPDLEAALGKLTSASLPPGVLKKALSRTLFTDDPLKHTFPRLAQWSIAAEFTKDMADSSTLVDTTILQKVRAAHPASQPATK